ncbi:nipped-B-like protein A isoform X2 [Antedon mediterranea]|uniref:nipped-B-like protein A isoform X2 n=1 Tax=Antedon mediterranea TaxID=105859 RepID=UPI003AF838B6
MNGEVPSVPITTLAGISSLTDLLSELPLPSPMPNTIGNKSLLYSPHVAEEARRLLNGKDDNSLLQVVQALSQTNTEYIELKDRTMNDDIEGDVPPLLQTILSHNPGIFSKQSSPMTQMEGVSPRTAMAPSPYYQQADPSQQQQQPQQQQTQQQQHSPYPTFGQVQGSPSAPFTQNSPSNFPRPTGGFHQPSSCQGSPATANVNGYNPNQYSPAAGSPAVPNINNTTLDKTRPANRSTKPVASASIGNYTNGGKTDLSARIPSATSNEDAPEVSKPQLINTARTSTPGAHLPGPSHKEKTNESRSSNSSTLPPVKMAITQQEDSQTEISTSATDTEPEKSHRKKRRKDKDRQKEKHYDIVSPPPGEKSLKLKIKITKLQTPKDNTKDIKESEPVVERNKSAVEMLEEKHSTATAERTVPLTRTLSADRPPSSVLDKTPPRASSSAHWSESTSPSSKHGTSPRANVSPRGAATPKTPKEPPKEQPKIERKHDQKSLKTIRNIDQMRKELEREKELLEKAKAEKKRQDELKAMEKKDEETPEDDVQEECEDIGPRGRGIKRGRAVKGYQELDSDEEMEVSGDENKPKQEPKKPKIIPIKEEEESDPVNKELMESATFKRFNAAIDTVFDSLEDVDVTEVDDEEDGEWPVDMLINKAQLSELLSESAKLKSMGVTNKMPVDRLVRLLNILERNIRDGARLQPNLIQDHKSSHERNMWREVTMERVARAIDATLTALYIMTSDAMPKEVFIEDVIDRIAQLTKFHLMNTIYPEFDPVYKVKPDEKAYMQNVKMKRARAHGPKEKSMLTLYTKLCEVVSNIAELLDVQILTDSTVLVISSLGTSPFFVENISEMQLSALKLISAVFSKYDKHRQLILEDIFASLAKLPTSKKNLRSYRLNSEQSIQMVTALVLQLIQCVVNLRKDRSEDKNKDDSSSDDDDSDVEDTKKETHKVSDVEIISQYETARRTGQSFLAAFLKKCVSKGEEDYRPLFENFVQDLLSTVNKPEWPSAELLLSLLGRLLMRQFSNKSNDMTMRVSSLEYLGQIASRLRGDAVSSQTDQSAIDAIVAEVKLSTKESSIRNRKGNRILDSEDEDEEEENEKTEQEIKAHRTQALQKSMLDYLAYNGQSDPSVLFARQYYIAEWMTDINAEVEKIIKRKQESNGENEEDEDETESEKIAKLLEAAEQHKDYLQCSVEVDVRPISIRRTKCKLTYSTAGLVVRYLASARPFSQSFDIYLSQILRVLNETAVAIRTKAMKCLAAVVEADPDILKRSDVQKSVHCRFMDQSTSVREAAVDLVGRFIHIKPDLADQYYCMLIERILDTGISVRKRVIKILRDICVGMPDFRRVVEICVKIIRRVNDEEGIKKLVNETFQTMWFTPLPVSEADKLLKRAHNIIEVVAACKDTGYDWLEQLLYNLLKDEEEQKSKPVQKACVQIVDCLVEHVLRLEEKAIEISAEGKVSSLQLVSCLQTLYLFSKVKPELMVAHSTTLQPYLSTKCSTQGDFLVVHNVARILELVVPLMDHPSEMFLSSLEEDMMKLIIRHGQMVLQSCVSCLAAVVNDVTHNYKLVRDCFQNIYCILTKYKKEYEEFPDNPALVRGRPRLLRALFTVGLFCKHFNFDETKTVGKVPVSKRVFDTLYFFCNREDEEIRLNALTGLGFLCNRHAEFMLDTPVKTLYWKFLESADNGSRRLLCQVLKNLQNYLSEEDDKMRKADAEWKKSGQKEDLKEMGDVQSGMSSSVMQMFLKHVMEMMLHRQSVIRMSALQVVVLTLKQGLVHPVQCVPYLVCAGSDSEASIRIKADQQLSDIDSRYPGFIHMKAIAGIRTALRLQKLLNGHRKEPLRGMRVQENVVSLCTHLYSMIRSHRQHRRALLLSLLHLYDESAKTDLETLVFVADNLSYFPYQTQDEPLFIMHHIELIVSVSGGNLLQSFKEVFYPPPVKASSPPQPASPSLNTEPKSPKSPPLPKVQPLRDYYEEDGEEDVDVLIEHIPEDPMALIECCQTAQGIILLLVLKQHLKDLFGFRDNTIHRYSPTESAKVYDKSLTRKSGIVFNPIRALEILKLGIPKLPLSEQAKKDFVEEYLDFKQLMELVDPDEDEEEEEERPASKQDKTPPAAVANQTAETKVEGASDAEVVEVAVVGATDTASRDDVTSTHGPRTPVSANEQSYTSRSRSGKRVRSTSKTPKPVKKPANKPKKRRKRYSYEESEEEEDDEDDESDDPDFMA